MDIRKIVGKRVKEIRTSLNLTQSDLAERAGVGDETISRMERGVQGVTLENLHRVSRCLRIPFQTLVDIDKPNEQVVDDVVLQEVIDLLVKSSRKTVKLVHGILKVVADMEGDGS